MFVIPAIRDVLKHSAPDSVEPVQCVSDELGFSAEVPRVLAVAATTWREGGIKLEITTAS